MKKLLALVTLLGVAANAYALPPSACYTQYQANGVSAGNTTCTTIQSPPNCVGDDGYGSPVCLNDVYYDSERVFYGLADSTGTTSYATSCAQRGEAVYRDRYVLASGSGKCGGGYCPGYWNFTQGLTIDYNRTGDTTSKNAAITLSTNAAGARQTSYEITNQYPYVDFVRENSYAIVSWMNAISLGRPTTDYPQMPGLVNQMIGYPTQWAGASSTKSFFVGLWANALIKYHGYTTDTTVQTNIQNAIQTMADYLWTNMRYPSGGYSPAGGTYSSFQYEEADTYSAPDLNPLISPMYAWLYCRTGSTTQRDRFDNLFCGGVEPSGYYPSGKQYDQSRTFMKEGLLYRDSVGHADCLAGGEAAATPTPGPTNTPGGPTPTPTNTATPTATATVTPVPSPTVYPTYTPYATPAPLPTYTPYPTPTPYPTLYCPGVTPTATPQGVTTPRPTPTRRPREPGSYF